MGKRQSTEGGAPQTRAADGVTRSPAKGRMGDEEAAALAEEFARMLTDEGAAPKGYVLSIAPRQLVVRDLDDVRARIRMGLGAEDLPRARASLSELARLLGM